ncbi:MAG: hypothetical protein Q8R92_02775 [Deltaproteobacteria bacterium]|nr:hypothetical protein [Deltaproteobacteria bacterium]
MIDRIPKGAGLALATLFLAGLFLAVLPGCRGEGKAGETGGARPSGVAADYFSCGKDGDCVVEAQRDCCPCNAGGKQVALARKAAAAYGQARTARCAGDLLCPQVYLCDESAEAVCRAGRCEIRGAPAPGLPAVLR